MDSNMVSDALPIIIAPFVLIVFAYFGLRFFNKLHEYSTFNSINKWFRAIVIAFIISVFIIIICSFLIEFIFNINLSDNELVSNIFLVLILVLVITLSRKIHKNLP